MATYYADTSVLVKRHLTEPGSVWVLSADDRLLLAAQAEGFVTDNPNRH